MDIVVQAVYFVTAILFIYGLRQMSSPVTARRGIVWAGLGMVGAVLITFFWSGLGNFFLITSAILLGGVLAWVSGKRVQMTNMPQMVALYNGMGGGAAACIAVLELMKSGQPLTGMVSEVVMPGDAHSSGVLVLALLGGLIGTVSFSGSLIAFAKLQGLVKRSFSFTGQHYLNFVVLVSLLLVGAYLGFADAPHGFFIFLFFLGALALGVTMTIPIGGADMPVVISLYNALTGLAVAFEGFVIDNAAMIVAGTVVGAAGTLLTQLMAKAMNRSLANVLFSGFGTSVQEVGGEVDGIMRPLEANDAAAAMAYANQVIVVPGYGMAVAQAQHKIWEFSQLLEEAGVTVKFAVHPVAGRMPGHMNVLLAEAGVPYDKIFELEEINVEFSQTDVALVIGANDVVNPDARTEKSSPIYGMPILDADRAGTCIVIKRGQGTGFSGIQNRLFTLENTRMLYGDGKKVASDLIQQIKQLQLSD